MVFQKSARGHDIDLHGEHSPELCRQSTRLVRRLSPQVARSKIVLSHVSNSVLALSSRFQIGELHHDGSHLKEY